MGHSQQPLTPTVSRRERAIEQRDLDANLLRLTELQNYFAACTLAISMNVRPAYARDFCLLTSALCLIASLSPFTLHPSLFRRNIPPRGTS
jgi:hypothetical protein